MNSLRTSRLVTVRQPKNINRQGGWTFWSLLFVLATVLFFSYVGMQLVPVYAENENVKNAMQLAINELDPNRATRQQVVRKLEAQLYLDGSHYLLDYKKELKVRRSKQKFIIEINYRQEIPLFFNLGVYANFDNIVDRDLGGSS